MLFDKAVKTIAKQKACQKQIYKLHSSRLRNANWNLTLPLEKAIRNKTDVIALADSQILRFIDQLNGVNTDIQAKMIKNEIKRLRRLEVSEKNKSRMKELYAMLYQVQFQEDYLHLVIDKNSDYDRANQGFTVNGVKYKRLLGTNGGIKNSTIVYVSERLYPELKRRIDNGRNMEMPVVPAKLEAYQALICSGSIPVSNPNGIIVIPDCETKFFEDVIRVDDSEGDEPALSFLQNQEITLVDSDGYGFMSPALSYRWNIELGGEEGEYISGVNTRGLPWTKGMLFTFDFVAFAEEVADTYEITDIWGDKRDVRDAEVILTGSMLKLWDHYPSWENYWMNTIQNGYTFAIAKVAPYEMDTVRNTNYQFLQNYKLDDDEIEELIKPTMDEICDAMGMDWRKSLLFLCGFGLNDKNVWSDETMNYAKALMADEQLINDPFIRSKIYYMIKKRIKQAKIGVLSLEGNFAITGGDPFSLAQSMFGLQITGLLKKGECYHKFWSDRDVEEIVCFRAPMTSAQNVRRMKPVSNARVDYWYKYIDTCMLLNSWDTTAEALNGSDHDGDMFYTTNNPILLKHTENLPVIQCIQRKAEKKVPTEEDLVTANKLSFGDAIGSTTNIITSQICLQAAFPEDSEEYKVLDYRIICGQLMQQNQIDKAKGIIAKPMPRHWYDNKVNQIKDSDTEEEIQQKLFNQRIVAAKKPYFFMYNYDYLKSDYDKYVSANNEHSDMLFRKTLEELYMTTDKSAEMMDFIKYYENNIPVTDTNCLVNRVCHSIEKYSGFEYVYPEFDKSILKSDAIYNQEEYDLVRNLYIEYGKQVKKYAQEVKQSNTDEESRKAARQTFKDVFVRECLEICPNQDVLCNIVIDLCYTNNNSKQFAWDLCGDTILSNILKRNSMKIHYPSRDEEGDIIFGGQRFSMKEKIITEGGM